MMRTACAALALAAAATAFAPAARPLARRPSVAAARSPLRDVALFAKSDEVRGARGEKLSAQEQEYWQGEWICADCGYIYDRYQFDNKFFETQKKGFKCPQCAGPRRRYARKIGDKVGVTLDGGDGPILIFSFAGAAATIAFGFWAATNL